MLRSTDALRVQFAAFKHAYALAAVRADAALSDEAKREQGPGIYLKNTIDELVSLGYTRRELIYIFDIESVTFDRWKDPTKGSMKGDSFKQFEKIIQDIIDDKPQHPALISDCGFITWQKMFDRYAVADEIWNISEGPFSREKSRDMEYRFQDLFKPEPGAKAIVWTYLFPKESRTSSSFRQLIRDAPMLRDTGQLRGSLFGIAVDTEFLPWFQPSLRMSLIKMPGLVGSPPNIEAYIRFKVPKPYCDNIFNGLEVPEFEQIDEQFPWMSIHKAQGDEWFKTCEARYLDVVHNKVAEQSGLGVRYMIMSIAEDRVDRVNSNFEVLDSFTLM